MANERTPVSVMAAAYKVTCSHGVKAAVTATGLSRRMVHLIKWAMDVAPQIKSALSSDKHEGITTNPARTVVNDATSKDHTSSHDKSSEER